jgi:hypothetical protein
MVSDPSYISRPNGQVAQLVEQRTENPRVGGSIPSLAILSKSLARQSLANSNTVPMSEGYGVAY